MKGRRIREIAAACIEIAIAAGAVALTGCLIWRYVQYGGGAVQTGQPVMSESGQQTDMNAAGSSAETAESAAAEGVAEAEAKTAEGVAEAEANTAVNTAETEAVAVEGTTQAEAETAETGSDLLRRLSDNPLIRVRLLTTDYESDCHAAVEIECAGQFTAVRMEEQALFAQEEQRESASERTVLQPGETFQLTAEELSQRECICVEADASKPLRVCSIERAAGNPEYEGCLWICREADGLVLINELLMETYLRSVVASEMPSWYPQEAQKAQAVCARTYAWSCIQRRKEESLADLDDSVSFQVYNNYRASESSGQAVSDTEGLILSQNEALYYSTSCLSEHREDLADGEAFEEFLEEKPQEGAEYDSPWLRWEARLSETELSENLKKTVPEEGGPAAGIQILERGGNGQVQKLLITDGTQGITVEGEYEIRRILAPHGDVRLMDGTSVSQMQLLPSAFFVFDAGQRKGAQADCITFSGDGEILLRGGGYGHGVGMSQCGAAALAESGADFEEILMYYYGYTSSAMQKK